MTVALSTIVSNIRTNTHHVEFDASRAVQGAQIKPSKALIMGIRLTAGTVAELDPRRILSGDQADAYYGVGSQLAEMCRAWKYANPSTEVWACGINALSGGTAGTVTLTVTASAALAGTIHLYIVGKHYVPIAVAAAAAQNDIATAIDTAIKAHANYARMPFTSGVATNVVTLTMKWKGVDVGDVRVNYNNSDQLPSGVTVAVAEGVAGAGNPDVSSIITAIGDVAWYDTIVMPWTDTTNMGLLETELVARWGGMLQIDGLAVAAVAGSHGTATSLGSARNSPHSSVMGANTSPTPPWIWAAVTAAVYAAEPDPARPLQTLALPGVLPAAETALWGQSDRNLLLFDGISTHVADPSGNVTIERMITTYQTNAQGVPDVAYLDVEPRRTLSAIRYDLRSSVSLRFPRYKKAQDGAPLPAGQPICTRTTLKAHIISRFDIWAELGWVEAASKAQFVSELIVEDDPSDVNRFVVQLGPDIMNQFRGMSAQIQFIL
jgi:phage tail sheath gpL-like